MQNDRVFPEIRVREGMGIWGNDSCNQCGACCYEWNRYLHSIGEAPGDRCENFVIKDGKAYCLAHDNSRKSICKNFFCGNIDFLFRFRYGGDEKLRKIAVDLGTVPKNPRIPRLLLSS